MLCSLPQRYMLITCLLGLHCVAHALTLTDAFHSLTSTTAPGIYQTQVRGYMTPGSVHMHFPTPSAQLVNIAPPNVSSGCNGIDIFMGGISFISGEQFVSLLKGIAANAMGYSFSLAMRTLCPLCAAVVSDLQQVAQSANRLAIHQCQFAMRLVNTATGAQADTKLRQQAALWGAHSGLIQDFLSGLSTLGDDIHHALSLIQQQVTTNHNPTDLNQTAQATSLGSDTWQLLAGLDNAQRTLIQSLLGTTVRYPYPYKHPKHIVVEPIGASMSMDQLTHLLMYGVRAKKPDNSMLWVNVCQSGKASMPWLIKTEKHLCLHVVRQRLQDTLWYHTTQARIHHIAMIDYGFFGLTYALLGQSLHNIAESRTLGSPSTVTLPTEIYGANVTVPASFTASEIQAFISMAPVPLYRALNFAAVYPRLAHAMVHNITEIIAAHYAATYLQERILNTSHAGNHPAGMRGLSAKKLRRLEAALRGLHQHLKTRVVMMISQLNLQRAWTHQVNRVQSTLHAEALEKGLDQVTQDRLHFLMGGSH